MFMSACYGISFVVTIKEENEQKVIETLQERIKKAKEDNVNYGIKEIPNTFKELLEIFFVEHQKMFNFRRVGNMWFVDSGFNASYGWECVMLNMFKDIAPYLENKSELTIDIDNDYDYLVVKNGKAIQKH